MQILRQDSFPMAESIDKEMNGWIHKRLINDPGIDFIISILIDLTIQRQFIDIEFDAEHLFAELFLQDVDARSLYVAALVIQW